MDNEGKFWLACWSIILIGVITIAICITTYYINLNSQIRDSIKDGNDPIEVICALDGKYIKEMCVLVAMRGKDNG